MRFLVLESVPNHFGVIIGLLVLAFLPFADSSAESVLLECILSIVVQEVLLTLCWNLLMWSKALSIVVNILLLLIIGMLEIFVSILKINVDLLEPL